ncbi:MAG: hypothetical protein ACRDCX_06010 [Aeromonas sp.]
MKTLLGALLEYRPDITDNNAFYCFGCNGFDKAKKTASKKYSNEYVDTLDINFVYEYSSFLGFVYGFVITDDCICGYDGCSFHIPLKDLRAVRYDNDDDEIVFSPKNGLSSCIKVATQKRNLAKNLVSIINDYK